MTAGSPKLKTLRRFNDDQLAFAEQPVPFEYRVVVGTRGQARRTEVEPVDTGGERMAQYLLAPRSPSSPSSTGLSLSDGLRSGGLLLPHANIGPNDQHKSDQLSDGPENVKHPPLIPER